MRLAGGQVAEHGRVYAFGLQEGDGGTARRSASRTPRCISAASARPRRRARGAEGWPCPSPRRRASRGRTACRTTAAGRPAGTSPGASTASCRGSAPRRPAAAPRSGDRSPTRTWCRPGSGPCPARGRRPAGRRRRLSSRSRPARSAPTLSAIVANGTFSSWPDSALVAGVKIGSIRSLSTSPAGKGVAADGPRRRDTRARRCPTDSRGRRTRTGRRRPSSRPSTGRTTPCRLPESGSRPASSTSVEIRWLGDVDAGRTRRR